MPKKRATYVKYSKEIIDEICDAIATSDKGIHDLKEENPHWPSVSGFFLWLSKYPEAKEAYKLAKIAQIDVLIDEIIKLSDTTHSYHDEAGNVRYDAAFTAAQRLKVDTRKWLACKLVPKVYGDKVQHDATITQKTYEEKLQELM